MEALDPSLKCMQNPLLYSVSSSMDFSKILVTWSDINGTEYIYLTELKERCEFLEYLNVFPSYCSAVRNSFEWEPDWNLETGT